MKNRACFYWLAILAILGFGARKLSPVCGAEPSVPKSVSAGTKTVFIVPHTHYEGAVFKTREEYLRQCLPYISQVLKLLENHPDYRFVLDQVCYVKPFLERYPQEGAAFRKFVKEGRLMIVGGLDVMPDVNMPGGESFVRQVLYGKGYFRRALGVDVTVGWQLDTFGHHAQMPQLLKLAGYKSFWFSRGPRGDFLWEGLDGSRIRAFGHNYGRGYELAKHSNATRSLADFTNCLKGVSEIRKEDSVILWGADETPPDHHVPPLAEAYSRQPNMPCRIRFAVPPDYEAAVKQTQTRVVQGEFNPHFQGTYSSRIELKQRTRELERLLTTSEKMGVLLRWLGVPADDEALWQAWEPMLFNQAHDLMSGVMTDIVYEDTVRGYNLSKGIADEELQTRLTQMASKIDTRGNGVPLVVWNTLGWPRTDVAMAHVDFSRSTGIHLPGVRDVKLVGPDGQPVPVQILDAMPNEDGSLRSVEVAFIARNVPAVGYSVYRLIPQTASAKVPTTETPSQDAGLFENEHYRVKFDLGGAITSLIVKDGNWEVLKSPGNVVLMEEDRGDLWCHNQALSKTMIKATGRASVLSNQQPAAHATVRRGPVLSEFTVSHPLGAKGHLDTSVRLYAGLRRIDIRTGILNRERFVRYRAVFPSSIQEGHNVHEIPFGALERPLSKELPTQNWIDYSNGEKGLTLLNRGLPGNEVATGGAMMVSLSRSSYLYDYNQGRSSDSGFELDKYLTFDYAMVPHGGDWRQAGVYHDGMEFNHPLLACITSSHAGRLPSRWGFIEISQPNVVLSALKGSLNGAAALRVYEASGQATTATIRVPTGISAAEEVNLMEDAGVKLAVTDNVLHIELHPFEIKTVRLQLQCP